jgi:hypothetical protein
MTAKKYKHDGKSLTIGQWAKETGLAVSCLNYRLSTGWDIEKALTTPSDTYANKEAGVGRNLHTGILASLRKVWEESGRAAFETQLEAKFQEDAIKTVLAFQNLLPRIVETDKQDTRPQVAVQINQTLKPEDFQRFKPLGG